MSERPWWPSRWGAGDEAGASNHITPAKVLEAMRGITDGKVYRLGHTYEAVAFRVNGGVLPALYGAPSAEFGD